MDWNVSLDDIIKSKQRSAPSRGRRLDGRRLYDPLYSSPRLSLSTSQLPNRLDQQRRRRRRREPSDDNYQGGDDLLVTRPAWGHVNPASIVITTKVSPSPSKKSEDRRPETKNVAPPAPFDKELSSSPLSAEQHQNDTSDLQQRVNDQNEHIVELQRLLNEPLPPLSFLADHPASCVVLFTNLDPAATSSGIRSACTAFGPVIRCQVTSEPTGGRAEVEFLDHRAASACVHQFNGQVADGRVLKVAFRPAPTRSGYRTTSHVLYTNT